MAIERNYFITMHHQVGVHFENFTEMKFRDNLLTGRGHRDRRWNRDGPGQSGTYGKSRSRLPWILKLLAKEGCIFQFRGVKPNFTTLVQPAKDFGKISYCPPLEKILPTPMRVWCLGRYVKLGSMLMWEKEK